MAARKLKTKPTASAAVVEDKTSTEQQASKPVPVDHDAARVKIQGAYRALKADASRSSVPIKSVGLKSTTGEIASGGSYCGIPAKCTVRQFTAVALACLAAGKAVKGKSTFPRRFSYNGTPSAIENGAGRFLVGYGVIAATGPVGQETLTLTSAGATAILSNIRIEDLS